MSVERMPNSRGGGKGGLANQLRSDSGATDETGDDAGTAAGDPVAPALRGGFGAVYSGAVGGKSGVGNCRIGRRRGRGGGHFPAERRSGGMYGVRTGRRQEGTGVLQWGGGRVCLRKCGGSVGVSGGGVGVPASLPAARLRRPDPVPPLDRKSGRQRVSEDRCRFPV